MILELPVRFTGTSAENHQFATLNLDVAKTALLLVDCYDDDPDSTVGQVIQQIIRPALAAARMVGIMPVFVYGGDHNDSHSINLELHGTRRGRVRKQTPWPMPVPEWIPGVEPQAGEAIIEKCGQNGFRETSLDFFLRTNGIETLLCAGFSFKSCLFYTMVGAVEHNYRVIFLRDATHLAGENEFPDTLNNQIEEKGWVRLVLTRLIEDHLGYSSTCEELMRACMSTGENHAASELQGKVLS